MGKKSPKRNMKQSESSRRIKKKTSILDTDKIEYVDWKDVDLLRRFMSDRAKIRASRVNGNNTQQQRDIANAIKNAREMALIPYTSRVTTQRGGKDRRGRGDRRDRGPREDRDDFRDENQRDENQIDEGAPMDAEPIVESEAVENSNEEVNQ
jgi:small subunit ribosomal protein S18